MGEGGSGTHRRRFAPPPQRCCCCRRRRRPRPPPELQGTLSLLRGRQLGCCTTDRRRSCEREGRRRFGLGCNGNFNEYNLGLHADCQLLLRRVKLTFSIQPSPCHRSPQLLPHSHSAAAFSRPTLSKRHVSDASISPISPSVALPPRRRRRCIRCERRG